MDIFQGSSRPIELLRYAGFFLWLCAGIPLVLMRLIYPQPLSIEPYVGWFLLHGLFGLMYWNMMLYLPERTAIWNRLMFLSLLTGSALGISAVSLSMMGGILLLLVSVIPNIFNWESILKFQAKNVVQWKAARVVLQLLCPNEYWHCRVSAPAAEVVAWRVPKGATFVWRVSKSATFVWR